MGVLPALPTGRRVLRGSSSGGIWAAGERGPGGKHGPDTHPGAVPERGAEAARSPHEDPGAKALQHHETWPSKASGRASEAKLKIMLYTGAAVPFPKGPKERWEKHPQPRGGNPQYFRVTPRSSALGEAPPSPQLLNHQPHVPKQRANCTGFVSAGLSSVPSAGAARFAEAGIPGSPCSQLSPTAELPSASPSPLAPLSFPR